MTDAAINVRGFPHEPVSVLLPTAVAQSVRMALGSAPLPVLVTTLGGNGRQRWMLRRFAVPDPRFVRV